MTYGRKRPSEDEPLTVEQIRDDGLELARHLRQRFGKRADPDGRLLGSNCPSA